MDRTKDSGSWLKFFKDAGIPTKTGASYAHIFVENRIHKDMLSDLSVDHLRLMGITLIGDVIAILRHAKSVHQDSLRKVVILKSKDDPSDSSSSSSSSSRSDSSSSSSSESDGDVKMVKMTKPSVKKNIATAHRTLESKVKKESILYTEEPRKQVKSKVIHNTTAVSASKTNSGSERRLLGQPLKRKNYESDQSAEEDLSVKKNIVKTTNSSTNTGRSILRTQDTPVKKIRVTTEDEFIGPKLPPAKKTVFDRLGAETSSPQVSSTTEVAKPREPEVAVETKFTRTIGNANLPVEPVKIVAHIDIPPPKSSSVFNRLGEITTEPSSSPPLLYAGVLKSPQPKLNVKKKIVTMRADEPEIPVKLRAAINPSNERNMRIRLGQTAFQPRPKPKLTRTGLVNGSFVNLASEGIFANPKNASHLSAKERLGLQSRQNALNKSAKERLGLQANAGARPFTQIRRPIQLKRQYEARDNVQFPLSTGAERAKKVSFGRVDHRLITPMRSAQGARNNKPGIHSRLGTRKFS